MKKIVAMIVAAMMAISLSMVAVAEENAAEKPAAEKVEKEAKKVKKKKNKKEKVKKDEKSIEGDAKPAAKSTIEVEAKPAAKSTIEGETRPATRNKREGETARPATRSKTLGEAKPAFISKIEVDLNVGLASESFPNTGSGFGLSVGVGYKLLDISVIKGSTLQVRGDIGYNHWSGGAFGLLGKSITYTRIPVSAGARLYVPIGAVKNLRVYGETSLELSIDKLELDFGKWGKESSSKTSFGLSPTVGVMYAVTPNIFVSGSLKYHANEDGYLSASVGAGYKF